MRIILASSAHDNETSSWCFLDGDGQTYYVLPILFLMNHFKSEHKGDLINRKYESD